MVDVNERGILINARLLAPGDEPVRATITVTNQRDGHSVQVPVTISPDPYWYTFDDDYIAAYAAEVLRLVNELRAERGVQPVSYVFEAQECANARSAELAVSFSHTRPDGSDCLTITDEYGLYVEPDEWGKIHRFRMENIISNGGGYKSNAGIPTSPESLAEILVRDWNNSGGHRGNMLYPTNNEMVVGLYVDENGSIYSAQWFGDTAEFFR